MFRQLSFEGGGVADGKLKELSFLGVHQLIDAYGVPYGPPNIHDHPTKFEESSPIPSNLKNSFILNSPYKYILLVYEMFPDGKHASLY